MPSFVQNNIPTTIYNILLVDGRWSLFVLVHVPGVKNLVIPRERGSDGVEEGREFFA